MRKIISMIAIGALLLGSPAPTFAAPFTWDGGGGVADTNINTATNWSGDINPTFLGADTVTFGTAGLTAAINADANFLGITFNRAAAFAIASGGGILTVGASGITAAIPSATSRTYTISVASLVLGASQTWTTTNNGSGVATLTVSSIVSDGGNSYGITKEGTGTLILSGNNTYAGSTTISGGRLQIGAGGTTGSVVGDITNNATLAFNRSDDLAYERVISGSGDLIKAGAGMLTLNGNNTFSGGVTHNASGGRLNIGHVNALGSGTYTMSGSNSFDNTSGSALTIANTFTLSGGSPTFVGSNPLTINGATTISGNNRTITVTASTLTLAGAVGEDGSSRTLTKAGAGTLTLSGNNTFSGGVTHNTNGGLLNIGHVNALGSGTYTIGGATAVSFDNTSGGALTIANAFTMSGGSPTFMGSNPLTINGAATISGANRTITVNASTLALAGVVGDSGQNRKFTKAGDGILTLSGANTFTGGFQINAGTLNINNAQALGTAAGTFTIAGGTIDNTSGADITTIDYPMAWNGDFTFLGTKNLNLGAGAVTMSAGRQVTVNGGTLTVGGVIGGGAVGLTKSGAGTLHLSGTNTYTGTTTVSAGTLALSGATNNNIASSPTINIASGAALDVTGLAGTDDLILASGQTLKGSGTVSGNLTIGTGSVLSPGNSPGKLTSVGDVTYAGGGTYKWEINKVDGTQGSDPGWDWQNITSGSLNITATAGSKFTIDITGLNAASISGAVVNFDKYSNYTWTVASSDTSIAGFSASAFTLSTGNFTNNNPITGFFSNGYFGIQVTGHNLELTYTGALDGPATAWWTDGEGDHLWNTKTVGNTTNWDSTQSGGVDTGAIPASNTDVYFYADGAGSFATTLGQDFTIHSLTLQGGTATSAVSIAAGNTLTINAGGVTINAGAGALTMNNDVVLGAAQTWLNNSSNTFTVAGSVDNGGFTLTADGTGNTAVSGVISNGALIKDGAGTLVLSGNNTYAGGTTISGGTLQIGAGAASGSVLGNITNNASLVFNRSDALTYSGIISGVGTLTQSGAGTLTLAGLNTYSGATTINSGTLSISAGSGLGTAPGVATPGHLTFNGGTLEVSDTFTLNANRGIALTGAGTIDVDAAKTLTYSGIIAGGGSLTKTDTGTLTLGGANTFNGGLVINAGTVSATSNSSALGLGSVFLGATSGSADATLLGDNRTFANPITVQAGSAGNTLTIGNSGGTSAVFSGAMTLNNALTVNAGSPPGGSVQLSGALSGAGALTASGASVVILSGDNSAFSGGVTLSLGTTLNLNNATALGTGTFVINGGTLNRTGGSGATLTTHNAQLWNGDFTYTGSSQSLNLGTGAVTLGANRQVTVGGNTLTVGGSIGDSGSGYTLTKAGAGTLALSGINTFSGATTINAGTLSIAADSGLGAVPAAATPGHLTFNGGTLEASETFELHANRGIALTGAGTIDVDAAKTLTYNGIIAGAGSLTKTDTGTLVLGGVNTYSGATTITGGTIQINSSNAFGTGAGGVTNNATLDIGLITLNIGGAYTQGGAPSTLQAAIDGTASGSIVATGACTINAGDSLVLKVSSYIPENTSYTIVDGGGGAGIVAPAIIVVGNSRVTFIVTGTGSDLILKASRVGGGFAGDATNSNAEAVGLVLDAITNPTVDMSAVLNLLEGSSGAHVAAALDTMYPDVSAGLLEVSRALARQSFSMLSNRMGGARSAGFRNTGVSAGEILNGVGVWAQELGSHMRQDERKGIRGYKANLFGTTIGVDKLIDRHVRMGLAGSYGWARVNSKQPGSPSHDMDAFQAAVYGSFDSLNLCEARKLGKNSREAVRNQGDDFWYVDGMLAFTQNNYDSRREIWLTPANKRVAKADHYGQQYSTNFETGYTFTFEKTKNLEVTPFASLGYNFLYMNKYKEKGAGALNLTVDGEGYHQLEQGLGMKLAYPVVSKKMGTFIPSIKAAWLYDYIGDRFQTTASFAGGGLSFDTIGAKPAKNGMIFGAELAFLNKGNVTLTGNWDCEVKDQFLSNTYYGTARYDF